MKVRCLVCGRVLKVQNKWYRIKIGKVCFAKLKKDNKLLTAREYQEKYKSIYNSNKETSFAGIFEKGTFWNN